MIVGGGQPQSEEEVCSLFFFGSLGDKMKMKESIVSQYVEYKKRFSFMSSDKR